MSAWLVGRILLALVTVIADDTAVANRLPADGAEEPTYPSDLWFTQYLDHFNITDNRQWKQKYQVVTEYYKDGGPVFLELGGPWPVFVDDLPLQTVTTYAEKFGAMVFQLEHRYYGESHPTSDLSTTNLIYLSTDQALADAAYFIKAMTAEHKLPEGTKWIAFGFSFASNLAVWLRDKYSHLVYAAVADSAPLQAKVDFYEFLNAAKESLARYNPECVTTIQEAHKKIKELLKTPEGQKIISDKFKLCEPIDTGNNNDVIGLTVYLADNLAEVVQYNGSDSGLTINQHCDILLNTSLGDAIDRYAAANDNILEVYAFTCTKYNCESIETPLQNISWEAELAMSGTRQLYYQHCTEFGRFHTSVHATDFFFEDIPLDWYIQHCLNIFGDNFNKDLAFKGEYRTNTLYGGLDSQATRVAYIYSTTDPWHILGQSKTKVPESPVFLIEGGWHQALSFKLTEHAPPAVLDVWSKVEELVGKWCTS